MIRYIVLLWCIIVQAQTITFDNQGYGSNDLLSYYAELDNFTFKANNSFATNYGSYKNVDEVSLYYYFKNINTDYIMLSTDESFNFESLLAYQVSEVGNHSLVITGFKADTVKYVNRFTNTNTWQMLSLEFINVDSVKFNVEGIGYPIDYNFDDFSLNGIVRPVEFIHIRRQQ